MIMKYSSKFIRRICRWPSAAVLATVGFVTTSPGLSNNKPTWIETLSLGELFSLETSHKSSKTDSETPSVLNISSEVPWWKKLFGMKQQGDDILEKYILDSIRKNERRKELNQGCVRMFETNWIAANKPIEDRHSEYLFKHNDLLFFGIFDGHSGWHCSETLRNRLPIYTALTLLDPFTLDACVSKQGFHASSVVEKLSTPDEGYATVTLPDVFYEKQKGIGCGEVAFMEHLRKNNKVLSVEEGLQQAFACLDSHICSEAIPDGKVDESLLTGIAGSCAIVALLELDKINIANAGDCRAVLGRRGKNGGWKAVQLSTDHCAESKEEIRRLNNAHPDQQGHIVMNGRLLGQLQPLRAFGDVQYKWSKHLHERVLNVVYGRAVVPPSMYKSPPYLTAEPEVTSHRIQAGDGFIILATDGLWEKVSNEHAVKIIGDYIDRDSGNSSTRGNGSTRLIRYALGKGNDETVAKMLQIPENYKRNFHDDITVTVVYFDSDVVLSKL